MTIDEALELERDKVATWERLGELHVLNLYAVSNNGHELLASERVDAAGRKRREAQLRQRRIHTGETESSAYLWTTWGGSQFVAWDRRGQLFQAWHSELRVKNKSISSGEIRAIVAFVDAENLGHRGLGVELHHAPPLVLARERDPSGTLDPFYNRDNLLIDGAWIWSLGRALANWLQVPFDDALTRPPPPDDFKEQAEQLAQDIVETLRRPGTDPDREAYEARKEAEDRQSLEAYYRLTGQSKDRKPRARTLGEMRFAASLTPCPECGSTDIGTLDGFRVNENSWGLGGRCPQCRTARSFVWDTEGNPLEGKHAPLELGDERPSQIIRPGQLMAELDRLESRVVESPEKLEPRAWRESSDAIRRALVCLNELLKFIPAGMKIIPDTRLTAEEIKDRAARRERYSGPWLTRRKQELTALHDRYVADAPRIWALEKPDRVVFKGVLDRDTLRAHQQWVDRGRTGEGRLELVGYDHRRGPGLGGVLFAGARLEWVTLDGTNLFGARMEECQLFHVSVREANARSIQLERVTLKGGAFDGSALMLARFDEAKIDGTSFVGTNLDCSDWAGATVKGANFDHAWFGNARLHRVHFERCSFERADFRPTDAGMEASTDGAVFEDCDLRGTSWAGRDVSNATFIRCRFAGASGKPAAATNVRIVDPDLSTKGDQSQIGTEADVFALWSGK